MSRYEANRALGKELKERVNWQSTAIGTNTRQDRVKLMRAITDKYAPSNAAPVLDDRPVCSTPTFFPHAREVCGSCGHLLSDHRNGLSSTEKQMPSYQEALLTWFLKNGGVVSTYGGYDDGLSALTKMHILEECSISVANSGEVEMVVESEFMDTDAGNTDVEMLGTSISCTCGQINGMPWRVRDAVSLGELIWQVIREGEKI